MSSMSGSGVGGSVGGTPMPTQRDIETSAWTQVNKQGLGIVHDTLEVPFSQLGGQVWKYSTDSSRPSLMPMGTLRTMKEETKPDESWKQKFDELLNKLPPQMKARLIQEYSKPLEMRNASYSAFEQTLTMLAKGMNGLEKAQEPLDPKAEARALHNHAIPGKALKGMIGHGRNMLEGADKFLNMVGPNHPRHDNLRHFANEGEDLQDRMQELLENLSDPNEEKPTAEEMKNLCKDIGTLNKEFHAVDQGKNLQILGTMLDTMEGVAQALSMTPASPALFMGLKTALKGIFSSESEAGLIGDDLEALMKALQNGMLSTMMKKLGPAKLNMLMMLLMSSLAGAGTMASLVTEHGLGRLPAKNEREQEAGRKFSFLLIMQFLQSADVMKTLYRQFAESCGQTPEEQETTANIMDLLNGLLMTMTAAKGKKDKAVPLLQEMQKNIGENIDKTEKFVIGAIRSGEIEGAEAKGLDIALQQARIALEKEDFEGLINACANALELMNSSPGDLYMDLEEIKEFSELLKYVFGAGLEAESKVMPGMIQAA